MDPDTTVIVLCPGQGAQAVGMGRAWADASPAARATFDEADAVLGDALGAPLSTLCFEGPADRLNRTDVSQPAIYTCSVASWRGLRERSPDLTAQVAAGLSLGEYTALHLAGAFDFATGLRLVARRGQLMQAAAEASDGGMVALIGADENQAAAVCAAALAAGPDTVLVPANFNAPGQIVLSGDAGACDQAVAAATDAGLRATRLTVAGAFHSPHMQPAADRMAEVLGEADLRPPEVETWSNVTAGPHDAGSVELLRRRLVEQIVSPVRWSQSCQALLTGDRVAGHTIACHELAPGAVLRGLMRRIDRKVKVTSHDEPPAT
ncbi:MAG: ACP S-malonyltransferase [Planctomycetota bacterium]|jgi:[acyl-carrier-protein] S-malonyltransferase